VTSGRITPTRPLPAEVTLVSWDIAQKAESNELMLIDPPGGGQVAAALGADVADVVAVAVDEEQPVTMAATAMMDVISFLVLNRKLLLRGSS
jgi:hypothetical protein